LERLESEFCGVDLVQELHLQFHRQCVIYLERGRVIKKIAGGQASLLVQGMGGKKTSQKWEPSKDAEEVLAQTPGLPSDARNQGREVPNQGGRNARKYGQEQPQE
jgi:hypothetical protein